MLTRNSKYILTPEKIITNAIGTNGRFQIWLAVLVSLSTFAVKWHTLFEVLVNPIVEHSECNPRLTKSEIPTLEINKKWIHTFIYELDIVCGKHKLVTEIQYLILSGTLFGNLVLTYLADRFGRQCIAANCAIIHCISGISAAFVPWLWFYVLLRWINNFTICGVILPAFSLLMEYTNAKHRPMVGVLFTLPTYLAHMLLGLVGYSYNRWDHIQLVVSLPAVLLISYWCYLPESPRWLFITFSKERVIYNLQDAAKVNKLPIENIREEVEDYLMKCKPIDRKKIGNLLYLAQTGRIFIKTAVLCLNWAVLSFLYFGIIRYVGQIGNQLFWNIGIAGFLKVFGNFCACFMVTIMDRKFCLIVAYFAALGPLFLMMTFHDQPQISIQSIGYLNIIGISASYSLIWAYSVEIFPTLVRNVGMGLCCNFARLGALLLPFIPDIQNPTVTPVIFASCLFVSGVFTFIFLPELEEVDMPDTAEEADKIWVFDILKKDRDRCFKN